MNYDIAKCGKRIHQLRKNSGYTQEQLAEKLNIDRSLLSYIEAGKRGCSVNMFIQFASFFNVSLDQLILGKEPIEQPNLLKADVDDLICKLETFKMKLG